MALPHTTFNRLDYSFYHFYIRRDGFKQAKPKTDVLAYDAEIYFKTVDTHLGLDSWQSVKQFVEAYAWNASLINQVKMVAYDKFLDAAGPRAQMLVNLAESQQSMSMLTGRLTQLASFSRHLRRLDFKSAARSLEMPNPPKGAKASKKFSSNWLEFHFGWAPLVADIYNCVDFFQSPLPAVKIQESASMPIDYSLEAVGDPFACGGIPGFRSKAVKHIQGKLNVKYGAELAITNPNLHLADALGLVNPATFVWEKIPFSFVVDWFVNVEQFLSTGTDFMGCTLQRKFTNQKFVGSFDHVVERPNCEDLNDPWFQLWDVVRSQRGKDISTPFLGLRAPRIWGWQRALTASALLSKYLKSF